MEDTLQQLGLTEPQIRAYKMLLDQSELTPPQLATALTLTRSNAYKILDRLVELGLASRERNKKFVYKAEDPIMLTELLSRERNRMTSLEQGVKTSIQTLRAAYQKRSNVTEAKIYHGSAKLKQLYEQQADLEQPIYFLPSRADIPTLGYETMEYVRHLPKQHGQQRFGIVIDQVGAPVNPKIDEAKSLVRTWLSAEEYTAPVEWSVCGDEITIFIFQKDGSAIRIKNHAVAESLRQIWAIMDRHLRRDPDYAKLPRKARRKV